MEVLWTILVMVCKQFIIVTIARYGF